MRLGSWLTRFLWLSSCILMRIKTRANSLGERARRHSNFQSYSKAIKVLSYTLLLTGSRRLTTIRSTKLIFSNEYLIRKRPSIQFKIQKTNSAFYEPSLNICDKESLWRCKTFYKFMDSRRSTSGWLARNLTLTMLTASKESMRTVLFQVIWSAKWISTRLIAELQTKMPKVHMLVETDRTCFLLKHVSSILIKILNRPTYRKLKRKLTCLSVASWVCSVATMKPLDCALKWFFKETAKRN